MKTQNNLIESFAEFKELKNIDRPTMIGVIKDVFSNTLLHQYGENCKIEVIVNDQTGDIEMWRTRVVVADEELEDEFLEISLSEARKIDEDYEIGEDFLDEIKTADLGRRTILALRQNLQNLINEREKDNIYLKYKAKIGQIIVGEVHQVWNKEILVLDEARVELFLPKSEQIPNDKYRKGDTIRAVIDRVEMKNSTPVIKLSRTSPVFLQRLFELEIPEILDGIITIKKIVRVPGERAKVAVESYDERIDPVGACVGMKGSRIHGICRELNNENIDIINYTNNINLYISRALSPAKISSMSVNMEKREAIVYLTPDQVSFAIGKGGLNIKLAMQLLDFKIDVFRNLDDNEEDVELEEFSDEIDAWIIEELKGIGCDTAKSVLNLSKEDLLNRTDLEEEQIIEVLDILKSEFEKE